MKKELKILFWNILADGYHHGFKDVTEQEMEWNIRWPKIVAHLRHVDADVVVLFEVAKSRFEQIAGDLSPVYAESCFQPKLFGAIDGTMILYRGMYSSFSSSTTVDDMAETVRWRQFLLDSGKSFVLGATHLKGRSCNAHIRESFMNQTMDDESKQSIPTIFVGDFNEDVENTWLGPLMIKHGYELVPKPECENFSVLKPDSEDMEQSVTRNFDHAFVRDVEVVRLEGFPRMSSGWDKTDTFYPSPEWPSDHRSYLLTVRI
jgi:endonuclease/exonuclease/phosphatase family metal-dependent hydrolase